MRIFSSIRQAVRRYSPRPAIHQWCFRREIPLRLKQSIASFTFDDFPKSALTHGGRLLEQFGARGTYYASLGLMGGTHPTQGAFFTREDLESIVGSGHELGCHTHDHLGARRVSQATFEAQILRNRERLAEILPGYQLTNFAYPGGELNFRVKRQMFRFADSSRGTYCGINRTAADLDLLLCQNLFESTPLSAVEHIVADCAIRPGWLVFYGHDVDAEPSVFGCTPSHLQKIVEIVARDCRIMTVRQALQTIGKEAAL